MRVKLERPERMPGMECHHVFGGSRRKHSEKWGCVIYLPPWLHNIPPNGVHHNAVFMDRLHMEYQARLEAAGWTREEFMETFGRNYID